MVAQALLGTNVQVAYGPDNLPIQYSTQTGEVIPNLSGPPQVAGYFIAQAATPTPEPKTIQLRTFPVVTVTPTPTPQYTPVPTIPGSTPPIIPGNFSKRYCVDDNPGLIIEPCDDTSKCDQPHGIGGPNGLCGTVIDWEHKIMDALAQASDTAPWDILATSVSSDCSYTAAASTSYVSTFNVIDAYRLAGFAGLDRNTHVTGASIQSFFQSNSAAGFRYITGTSMNGVGPGWVMFFPSGHVAMVNHVEIDANGNGKMSFLHSGGGFYLGLGIIVNGNLVQTSADESVTGFGGHTTALPFSASGIAVCTTGA